MDREKVLEAIKAHRETIEGFGVKKLGLFGSCARGESCENSDLDFVVEFKQKSFDGYMDLKFFLEDLFQCKVDLVLKNVIKPRLKTSIIKETVYAEGF